MKNKQVFFNISLLLGLGFASATYAMEEGARPSKRLADTSLEQGQNKRQRSANKEDEEVPTSLRQQCLHTIAQQPTESTIDSVCKGYLPKNGHPLGLEISVDVINTLPQETINAHAEKLSDTVLGNKLSPEVKGEITKHLPSTCVDKRLAKLAFDNNTNPGLRYMIITSFSAHYAQSIKEQLLALFYNEDTPVIIKCAVIEALPELHTMETIKSIAEQGTITPEVATIAAQLFDFENMMKFQNKEIYCGAMLSHGNEELFAQAHFEVFKEIIQSTTVCPSLCTSFQIHPTSDEEKLLFQKAAENQYHLVHEDGKFTVKNRNGEIIFTTTYPIEYDEDTTNEPGHHPCVLSNDGKILATFHKKCKKITIPSQEEEVEEITTFITLYDIATGCKKILSCDGIMGTVNAFTADNTALLIGQTEDNITIPFALPLWFITGKVLPLHELLIARILHKLRNIIADDTTIKNALDGNLLSQEEKNSTPTHLGDMISQTHDLPREKAIEFIIQAFPSFPFEQKSLLGQIINLKLLVSLISDQQIKGLLNQIITFLEPPVEPTESENNGKENGKEEER